MNVRIPIGFILDMIASHPWSCYYLCVQDTDFLRTHSSSHPSWVSTGSGAVGCS